MEWNVFEALRGTLLRGLEGLCMSRRYVFLHTTKDLRRQYSVLGIECEFRKKTAKRRSPGTTSADRRYNLQRAAQQRPRLALLLFGRGHFASVGIEISAAAYGGLDGIDQVNGGAGFQHQAVTAGAAYAVGQPGSFVHGENDYFGAQT